MEAAYSDFINCIECLSCMSQTAYIHKLVQSAPFTPKWETSVVRCIKIQFLNATPVRQGLQWHTIKFVGFYSSHKLSGDIFYEIGMASDSVQFPITVNPTHKFQQILSVHPVHLN